MLVKEILKRKGPEVITIGRDKTLKEALDLLINNSIGVLPSIDDEGKIKGILSERDILKRVKENPAGWASEPVKVAMTEKVIIVEPDDDTEYVETIMTENRIRHLPVVKNKVLVGIISIGDIVKNLLSDKRFENKYLMDYISGNVR